jgi:hypothetical protein
MIKTLLAILLLITISIAKDIPTDNQIQGRLNIINGASAECVMHHFYTNSGWIQIKGEIGRNGIDGLYYKKKNGRIKEILVAESKWNKSRLGRSGKNKAVLQMSQEWVLRTMNKLIKYNPTMPYQSIRQLIEHNQYRARLFKLKPVKNNKIQISIFKIKNKGSKAFDQIPESKLRPIDINTPKNSFEKGIVGAYNSCRKKYLLKYLPTLEDKNINYLLQDNYIQKKDVKHIIKL